MWRCTATCLVSSLLQGTALAGRGKGGKELGVSHILSAVDHAARAPGRRRDGGFLFFTFMACSEYKDTL